MFRHTKKKRIKLWLSPLFFGALVAIVLALFVINSIYSLQRTEKTLINLIIDDGYKILHNMEKGVKNIFSLIDIVERSPGSAILSRRYSYDLFYIDNAVGQYLLSTIFMIDKMEAKEGLSHDKMMQILKHRGITWGNIYTKKQLKEKKIIRYIPHYDAIAKGKKKIILDIFRRWPKGRDSYVIAAVRKFSEGLIVLELNENDMEQLKRRFALQKVIDDIKTGRDIVFAYILDKNGKILAHSKPEFYGETIDDPYYQQCLSSSKKKEFFRKIPLKKGEYILEFSAPILARRLPKSLLTVGISTKSILPILKRDKKNIFLVGLLLMILGTAMILFLFRIQSRHLKKMQELEEKIHTSEKISSMGNLAAGVAHEIRNPLNAVNMAVQRLQREFLPAKLEEQKEFIEFTDVIRKEIKRVNDIIEQFINFSRITEINRKKMDIIPILKELILISQELATIRGVQVKAKFPDNPVNLWIDKDKIKQALINLVYNGIEAIDNSGKVTISLFTQKNGIVQIDISDTGHGIPDEELSKIFEHYYTTKDKGLGLGLPIAYRIVAGHGGTIEVKSEIGKGSTFSIILPENPEVSLT